MIRLSIDGKQYNLQLPMDLRKTLSIITAYQTMEASMGTDEIFILVQEMRECDTLNKQPAVMFLVSSDYHIQPS